MAKENISNFLIFILILHKDMHLLCSVNVPESCEVWWFLFHARLCVHLTFSVCFMPKISEKLEEKNTSGTNRLSTDLCSTVRIYESSRDKCSICLSVKRIFLPFLFMDMDLALYQSLRACSLHVVPKATACLSLSFGHSDSICYFALYSAEKAPVCLICNGCQGLGGDVFSITTC